MPQGTLITWTLSGTYLVTGHVTGFEYEDLPGVEVTITNLRTNEDMTVEADEDGSYSVDLGDTGAGNYEDGYAMGDEVLISCTHRDVTRTWKRRVAGSTLEQDVHFTHGTWRGALKKARLLLQDSYTGQSAASITIRDANTRGVDRVYKNGDLLGSADWSFTPNATLSLAVQAQSSDGYDVHRLVHVNEADAKRVVVNDGDAPVRNATARYYGAPLPTRVPELQDLSEALAAAALRDRIFGGSKGDEEAKTLRKAAQDALEAVRTGSRGLTDQDGAFLTPSAQNATTPRSSTTPTRRFEAWDETRLDL